MELTLRGFPQFIIGLMVAASFGSACAITRAALNYQLEMDQDPTAAGWVVQKGGGSGTHSVAGGMLTINSSSFYEFVAPDSVMQSLSNANGWAIDARFKFSGGTSDMVFWVWDGAELNKVNVGHSSIIVYPGAIGRDLSFRYTIGTDFHTYRLEAMGEYIRMKVDGNIAFDIAHLGPTGGTPIVMFGDGYDSNSTVSVWDYYRISSPLPEPTILASLGVSVLCLIRRKR